MNISKLSVTAIEHRVEEFSSRIKALNEITKDIKDPNAMATLEGHLDKYKISLDALKKELVRRKK